MSNAIELDPRLAEVIGVPRSVHRTTLAAAMARNVGHAAPDDERLVGIWVDIATCMEQRLIREALEVTDSAEVSYYPQVCLQDKWGGLDGQHERLEKLGCRSLDDLLGDWLNYDVAEGLADRGAFRLAGRRGRAPSHAPCREDARPA